MGDNTGHSPAGPQRRFKIVRPREHRKAAGAAAELVGPQPRLSALAAGGPGRVGSGVAALDKPGMGEWKRLPCW